MKNQWKVFTIVFSSIFLFGCTNMAEKKQLEEKVASLVEILNSRDMEIQKLKDDLAAAQQPLAGNHDRGGGGRYHLYAAGAAPPLGGPPR